MTDDKIVKGIELLSEEFGKQKVESAIESVENFQVEIPSWIFGDFGGGRFGEYTPPGCARNIIEKLNDAALINELTGAAGFVATHVLWDYSADGYNISMNDVEKVSNTALELGLQLGSISPTYFLKGSHLGSLSSGDESTRSRYIDQTVAASEIADKYGNKLLTLWLPDGSSYPGQVNLIKSLNNLKGSLSNISEQVSREVRVLIEYKVFEPGTYSTVIPDWGTAYILALEFGPNAGVLVDLGHHHHSVNIEQIIAGLISKDMYCGFHFNTRYAADDDHAVEPNPEMARIFYELVAGNVIDNPDNSKNWAYMVDQCSSRENRMLALLHSIDSLQLSLAKASLVDGERLEQYQNKDQIILANRYLNSALLNSDVRPILAAARAKKNLPVDPVEAYVQSGYQKKIEEERD